MVQKGEWQLGGSWVAAEWRLAHQGVDGCVAPSEQVVAVGALQHIEILLDLQIKEF